MLRIGLTGGIGSGKTTVARIFGNLGIPVYYADQRARQIMEQNPEVRDSVEMLLGNGAYQGERLHSGYVATKVFNSPEILQNLNRIVHPAVHADFRQWSDRCTGVPYVIQEAAILFETGSAALFDFTIVVIAPEQDRIRRVMLRDGISEEKVRERMKNQMPDKEKSLLGDYQILNDGSRFLTDQVLELHNKFVSLQS